jgi:hypothetical protein
MKKVRRMGMGLGGLLAKDWSGFGGNTMRAVVWMLACGEKSGHGPRLIVRRVKTISERGMILRSGSNLGWV